MEETESQGIKKNTNSGMALTMYQTPSQGLFHTLLVTVLTQVIINYVSQKLGKPNNFAKGHEGIFGVTKMFCILTVVVTWIYIWKNLSCRRRAVYIPTCFSVQTHLQMYTHTCKTVSSHILQREIISDSSIYSNFEQIWLIILKNNHIWN